MSSFDIVIVGAGVVGLTAALALSKKTKLQIGLLESNALTSSKTSPHYDLRVSAMSLASQRLFHRLGVWEGIAAARISPYKKMFVWDQDEKTKLEFDSSALHAKQLGWIIEDNVMRASLLEEVYKQKNLKVETEIKLQTLQSTAEGFALSDGDKTWHAKLVIAADGAHSWIRNAAAIPCHEKDYEQKALVATVNTQFAHNETAYQCFLKSGPLAFLPLKDSHQCSIVWSLSNDEADEILNLSDDAFKQKLSASFANHLGAITHTSPRKLLPLSLRQAKTYIQDRLALIGDAAHTIHPLAGQGVNLGLLDVACLIDVIIDALSKERNYWSFATLRRYERNRKTENALMLNFVDNIKKLFESDNKPINFIKEISLNSVNNTNFLKTFFTAQAVGNKSLASLTKP